MIKRISRHASLAIALLLVCLVFQTPQAHAEQISNTGTMLTLQFEGTSPDQGNDSEQVPQDADEPSRSLPKTGDVLSRGFALIGIGTCAAATCTAALLNVNRRRRDDVDAL